MPVLPFYGCLRFTPFGTILVGLRHVPILFCDYSIRVKVDGACLFKFFSRRHLPHYLTNTTIDNR